MPLPKVAIVGRPNVGKSSLLNRFAGRRVSIVEPTPGVTRDRISTIVELRPPLASPGRTVKRTCEFVDTGGYGVYVAEGKRFDDIGADLTQLTGDIEAQIRTAIDGANVILFVADAQHGLTPMDCAIAEQIRDRNVKGIVILIANKVDDDSWSTHGAEFSSLGFGEPACVSALNGFGMNVLKDLIFEQLRSVETEDLRKPDELKLAIVGKRNSGKSTLINTWAGEPRVIVSEIAGTTRDAVDVRFEAYGKSILAIDTAGIRKRKSFADDIEFYASRRMIDAVRRADVALLLIDSTADVSQVDKKLALELQHQFKPTVIVVNKWDLAEAQGLQPEEYFDYLTQELRGLDYAPIIFASALNGQGIHELVSMAFNLFQQASHRESTSRLNDAMEGILKKRGPSSKLGTRAKVFYVTQVSTNPPTIVVVVNEPKLFRGAYSRYLMNELRDCVPYSEVPIRLLFRKRERVSLSELKARSR